VCNEGSNCTRHYQTPPYTCKEPTPQHPNAEEFRNLLTSGLRDYPQTPSAHVSTPSFFNAHLQDMRVGRLPRLPSSSAYRGVRYPLWFRVCEPAGKSRCCLGDVIVCLGYILLIIARLHDAGHSGWWWPLALFTSLLGLIAVAAVSGTRGANTFGEEPSGKLTDLLVPFKR
jgi:hypothetical protein